MNDPIVGIDLGTTNSEIAALLGGEVQVLDDASETILPSYAGLAPDGQLIVGTPARNQYVVYPERTVKSIKRLMGTDDVVSMGDGATYSPAEVSAMILRALKERAERKLGTAVKRAVITVPAYFSDRQRQATRDAGAIAGLEVVRILNEPTAAALAYGAGRAGASTLLVYDLGGGTFDVSLVRIDNDVTEVLASHGNNRLGGDDFDHLVVDSILARLPGDLKRAIEADRRAMSRIVRAAEEARKRLSFEPHTVVREENLVELNGVPQHVDLELDREQLEETLLPLLKQTLESVHRALTDAGKSARDLDGILLVGGATRTPLVSALLEEATGLTPRQDLHPDLCVALGAGVQAARLEGHDIARVLVDISPWSFGVSHFGYLRDVPTEHCYKAVIARNTPLPASRTEAFGTMHDGQDAVRVSIFQGEDPDALRNIFIGDFMVEGLSPVPAPNEILCRMDLDLDGILRVTATEKATGLTKQVTIERATAALDEADLAKARARVRELFADGAEDDDFDDAIDVVATDSWPAAEALLTRSRALLDRMPAADREEAIALNEDLHLAIQRGEKDRVTRLSKDLEDFLFFVEER
ncbi:MAG TPA: Hsp70 family protein [Thermoanaerobaculia bacterium]|nr:Hsp70 family protein [Thermoanaerobaculia bacterium]